MVKIAPAATDSPIDPAVRAMFSSSSDPFQARMAAMAITAAGYVAAMVMPARRPKYALAAPRTIVIRSPSSTARRVNSFISMCSGTKGTCFLTPVPGPGTGLLIGGILAEREMKAISYRNLFKTLNGGTLARGWGGIQVRVLVQWMGDTFHSFR